MSEAENIVSHNHDLCIKDALDKAAEICTHRGLRLTYLRKRVLELVWQAHKPIGAYTILSDLSEDGRKVAPPTVYRALDFLMEEGFVHRLASLNAFVGCPDPGHSSFGQFLICKECSEVIEMVDTGVIDSIENSAAEHGFNVQGQIIEVVGICPRCQLL